MSRFKRFTLDQVKSYRLADRPSKVSVEHFARPFSGGAFTDWVNSLPSILAADRLRALVDRILVARTRRRSIIWGFGGHVVKVGLAPVLIDLMDRGLVTALATNGAGMIHDFEIALCGNTSEDVDRELGSGAFGMARETSELLNQAASEGASLEQGMGEAVGSMLDSMDVAHQDASLFLQAHRRNIPLTVHVAIGTDIIHNHPSARGEAIGKSSLIDFQIFTAQVAQLNDGGVYLNLGSAVLLPEVFLKAVSLVRHSGAPLKDFTTANLDFLQHYRPLENVVRRPVLEGGQGFSLTGHHEILIPLLAAMLVCDDQ